MRARSREKKQQRQKPERLEWQWSWFIQSMRTTQIPCANVSDRCEPEITMRIIINEKSVQTIRKRVCFWPIISDCCALFVRTRRKYNVHVGETEKCKYTRPFASLTADVQAYFLTSLWPKTILHNWTLPSIRQGIGIARLCPTVSLVVAHWLAAIQLHAYSTRG